EAIETHGVFSGLGMTAVRVGKCHPFHPGGYDPVPTDHQPSAVEEGM
ncbi:MAG: membrane protein insertion efficiency factor YidD, partial [Gammaproteobacteria bacterium]|nr:membrane protein insertion efficiency factor YidD [Gammaproteobacteria bacterium]